MITAYKVYILQGLGARIYRGKGILQRSYRQLVKKINSTMFNTKLSYRAGRRKLGKLNDSKMAKPAMKFPARARVN